MHQLQALLLPLWHRFWCSKPESMWKSRYASRAIMHLLVLILESRFLASYAAFYYVVSIRVSFMCSWLR